MIENSAYNEKELLSLVSRDSQEAFSILLDIYRDKVFSHALTYMKSYEDAEELVQDIFMKVWNARERLTEVTQFKNYLFILGRNQLVSAIRKKVMDTSATGHADLAEDLLVPDKQYEFKETNRIIMEGIERLSPQQKAVFTLSRVHHLSHEEISIRLGISKRTVKFHLVLALNFMREFLHDTSDHSGIMLVFYLLRFLYNKKNF